MEIKTKYSIGDKVYAISNNKVIDFIIYRVAINVCGEYSPSIFYSCYYPDEIERIFDENEVFSTKEELLKSL